MEKAVFETAGPHEPTLFATPAPWHQKAIEPSVNGGFNGFRGYGYPQQGTGELGSPPRGRPGGNGA